MTNNYNDKDNKKTGQSQSTSRKRGRPQGYKVTAETRARLSKPRTTRGRPLGPSGNNVTENKRKLPSDNPDITTLWARYQQWGWLVTGYKCNKCNDFYRYTLEKCERHVAECRGLTRQQKRNTKKTVTEELIIRLTSGEVVVRKEMK